jgi:serine/threonine protein kinase/lipopolysaccharide biosynthesis regulator YciM
VAAPEFALTRAVPNAQAAPSSAGGATPPAPGSAGGRFTDNPIDPAVPDIDAIFSAAIEIASPEERAQYVQNAAGGDEALLKQLHELVGAYFRAGSFLESPPVTIASDAMSAMQEAPGTSIGRYKLLEQIGEGGFGIVFMAQQEQPVHRRVALKIIKAGMDTRQVVARFEAERQALAMMDHPNIAKVLDAGATTAGRPYFVMELIKGIPITKYCDEHRLTPRQRLELFIPVCQAVQHAHQKGIIHRDLKPSNVLVADYDDKPVVKIIDFGVARAVGQHLTEKTMFTQFGQIVGTIEYMSPEQAKLNQLDIDTRTDIYSLGVLLYELLSGETPFDKQRLREAAFDEMLRIVREEEPPRPSTRLNTSESLPSIAANRHLEPKKLTTMVRGDLDWIVMKCLDKDRNRRYETANNLGQDLQRYLTNEPVQACPPSTAYKMRKFVQRYRAAIATAAAILCILMLGVVVSTWQAIRATRAEEQAIQDRDDKEQARREAVASAEQAQKAAEAQRMAKEAESQQRQQAEQVSKYLISAFSSPDPGREGRSITVAEVLDRDARALQDAFNDAPLTKAALMDAIGRSYCGLGLHRESIALLEQSLDIRQDRLGAEHDDTLATMTNLAESYWAESRVDDGIGLLEKELDIATRRFGPDDERTLQTTVFLAAFYRLAGRISEALPMMEDAVRRLKTKLAEDDPKLFWPMRSLADIYSNAKVKRYQEAVDIHKSLLRLRTAKLGPEHPDTLFTLNDLGRVYTRMGQPNDAIPLLQEALRLRQAKLGADSPGAWISMESLAAAYRAAGRLRAATSLELDAFRIKRARLGSDDSESVKTLLQWAKRYNSNKEYAVEIAVYEELLKLKPDSAEYLAYLAQLLTNPHSPELSDPARAIDLATKAIELAPNSASTWAALGWVRFRSGDWQASIDAMAKNNELLKQPDIAQSFRLAIAHWRLGQTGEAHQWYEIAVELMEQSDPKDARLISARAEAAELLGIPQPQSAVPPAQPDIPLAP